MMVITSTEDLKKKLQQSCCNEYTFKRSTIILWTGPYINPTLITRCSCIFRCLDPSLLFPRERGTFNKFRHYPMNGTPFASSANILDTLSSVVRADENRCDSPIDGLTGHSFFSRDIKGRRPRIGNRKRLHLPSAGGNKPARRRREHDHDDNG